MTEKKRQSRKKFIRGRKTLALFMAGTLMGSNIMSATAIAAGNSFIDNTGTGDVLYGGIGQEQSNDTIVYSYEDYEITYVHKTIDAHADNISITITNKSNAAIENWTLQSDVMGAVSELYNATVIDADGVKQFKNANYNQDILPGESVEFGFHLQYEAEKVYPSYFEILTSQNEIKDSKITIEHVTTNEWNGGYVAEIRLTNNGETTIEDWVLIFQTENRISNLWSGSLETVGDKYYVIKNPSYNQNLEPGETIVIGYQGVGEFHSGFAIEKVTSGEDLEQELQELEKEEFEQTQESEETESSEESEESVESSESEETEETTESEESTEETSVEESETDETGESEETTGSEGSESEETESSEQTEERDSYIALGVSLEKMGDTNAYLVDDEINRMYGSLYSDETVEKVTYDLTDSYEHQIMEGVLVSDPVSGEWSIEPFGMVLGINNLNFYITLSDENVIKETYLLVNYEIENMDAIGLRNDDDEDGLYNYAEVLLGTDQANPDSDGDGLKDGDEAQFTMTDPTLPDTDNNGILDSDEDFDSDKISNIEEIRIGTYPYSDDSDMDGIIDGEEVYQYESDPLNPDSDGDTIQDGDELKLGLDPKNPDSDNDGLSDGQERIHQSIDCEFEETLPVKNVSVEMDCPGMMEQQVTIEDIMETNRLSAGVVGLVGHPVEIESEVAFDTATI